MLVPPFLALLAFAAGAVAPAVSPTAGASAALPSFSTFGAAAFISASVSFDAVFDAGTSPPSALTFVSSLVSTCSTFCRSTAVEFEMAKPPAADRAAAGLLRFAPRLANGSGSGIKSFESLCAGASLFLFSTPASASTACFFLADGFLATVGPKPRNFKNFSCFVNTSSFHSSCVHSCLFTETCSEDHPGGRHRVFSKFSRTFGGSSSSKYFFSAPPASGT
mmetsp:Transcript_8711/g.21112  ORF Transcript_8711/g.21112 Transcript_8711/m.21112 type:complete len:221 (-) Transcript_8711:649-1311(-)